VSWSQYVKRLTGGDARVDVGKKAGTTGQTVGRWLAGETLPQVEQAVALARAYGDSPLNALIALGYITPLEAKQRPVASSSWDDITNEDLAELVAERLGATSGGIYVDRAAYHPERDPEKK
jgi:transcriptional regulator with XRE-family HTH domain